MTTSQFMLSAFGDEIHADLATQLAVLASEGVTHLEVRSAWGKNVLDLDHAELTRARGAGSARLWRFRDRQPDRQIAVGAATSI